MICMFADFLHQALDFRDLGTVGGDGDGYGAGGLVGEGIEGCDGGVAGSGFTGGDEDLGATGLEETGVVLESWEERDGSEERD
jgi:hypothetical protein